MKSETLSQRLERERKIELWADEITDLIFDEWDAQGMPVEEQNRRIQWLEDVTNSLLAH